KFAHRHARTGQSARARAGVSAPLLDKRKEVAMDNVDEERLARAKKRVEDIKGFYVHFGIYVIVNLGLFVINMLTNPDGLWFYWPLLGWGIGVAIHGFALLTDEYVFGPEWENRKVHEILGREDPHVRTSV
ncbi:MAG TPA: 2TM domain-containing protein, partial [Actinomycetota bacterium]|nr:2TM domain-containing protein [Actinomycetota bacterium]